MYIGVGGIYVPRYVGNSCTQVWGVFMYPGMRGFTNLGMGGIHVLCTQVWRGFMYPVMGGFMYPGMGGFMFPGMGIQVHRYGGIHVPRFGVIHGPRYSGWGDSTNGRLSFFPLYEMFLNITFEPFKNQITHKAWNIQALLFYNILSFSRLNIYTLSLNMFIVLCRQIVF